MYNCARKNIIITGGTSGIGLATAKLLLADGALVAVIGRSREHFEAVKSQLSRAWQRNALAPTGCERVMTEPFTFLAGDLAKGEDCLRLAAAAVRFFGGQPGAALTGAGSGLAESHAAPVPVVDILINCAGVYRELSLAQTDEAAYDKIFAINVKGLFFLTRALEPYLRSGGSIVNVASDAGLSGNYGCAAYCASKGAVVALTRAWALDFAPRLRVNCICPGDVDTPLVERQLAEAAGSYTKEQMGEVYPLGRIGRAQEVAHVICAVASSLNSFMTGAVIPVDGGLTAK
jgi:NAD(P)-dependent dehydrogenase (short-subunit alcohol dehydrogenase family)